MSSRGRGRGRGYFGRGNSLSGAGGGGSGSYRHREEHNNSHRGEHHSSYRGTGEGQTYRGGRGAGSGEYGRHKEMPPPHREHHREERYTSRRGGGGGDRSGYDQSPHHHSRRSSPPSHHRRLSPTGQPRRPEHILAKLGPDEQVALTKALVATVLRGQDGRDGARGYRDDRGDMRSSREDRSFRDDGREYRERRPPSYTGVSSRYHGRGGYREDRGGRGFYRGRGGGFRGSSRGRYDVGLHERLGMPFRGDTRRRYPDNDDEIEPAYKRQRVNSEGGSAATGGTSDRLESRVSRDRDTDEEDDDKVEDKDEKKGEDTDGDEETSSKNAQATSGSDGGRASKKDSESSNPFSSTRLFVELQCPHCPTQCSITFQEYKYHLASSLHLNNMDRLARKHSHLLLRIRKQQRAQQKELEDEYLKKNPDHAEISVSRFCGTCKLNYRCLGGDVKEGVMSHCRSRLHKMHHYYLHPRCGICSKKGDSTTRFKSRMVYEHHVASIAHMKNKTERMEAFPDDFDDNGMEDVNLDGFMTVDSVGEADEEVGSEHDEITGGDDAKELVLKAAQDGADELDEDGAYEPIGMSYVQPMKVYYCVLCYLNFKESAIRQHCVTPLHRAKYYKIKDKEAAAAEAERKKSDEKSSDFPRSGGRAEGRHTDDEDEDEEEVKKVEKDANEEDSADTKDGESNAEKDDSEKDYEEYNEKYESYDEPRNEDYEDQDDEDVWDEMDKGMEGEGDAEAEEMEAEEVATENGDKEEKEDKQEEAEEVEEEEEEMAVEEEEESEGEKEEEKLEEKSEEAEVKQEEEIGESSPNAASPPRRSTRQTRASKKPVETEPEEEKEMKPEERNCVDTDEE